MSKIYLSFYVLFFFHYNNLFCQDDLKFIPLFKSDSNLILKYFEYEKFPELRPNKPDISQWIYSLNSIESDTSEKLIVIAYKNNSIYYIRTLAQKSGGYRLEILNNNKTKSTPLYFEDNFYWFDLDNHQIYFSPRGITIAQPNISIYSYENNLLNQTSIYLVCSEPEYWCLWKTEHYKYFDRSNKVHFIEYKYHKKIATSETDKIIEYDILGNKK
ncbi:MAG: hypothetical protein JXA68_01675 [Ignavibacteriales bacterium]|nr:hypothetical protein [Ignavibacteriales bacterium]